MEGGGHLLCKLCEKAKKVSTMFIKSLKIKLVLYEDKIFKEPCMSMWELVYATIKVLNSGGWYKNIETRVG